jgi:hypothetical protein
MHSPSLGLYFLTQYCHSHPSLPPSFSFSLSQARFPSNKPPSPPPPAGTLRPAAALLGRNVWGNVTATACPPKRTAAPPRRDGARGLLLPRGARGHHTGKKRRNISPQPGAKGMTGQRNEGRGRDPFAFVTTTVLAAVYRVSAPQPPESCPRHGFPFALALALSSHPRNRGGPARHEAQAQAQAKMQHHQSREKAAQEESARGGASQKTPPSQRRTQEQETKQRDQVEMQFRYYYYCVPVSDPSTVMILLPYRFSLFPYLFSPCPQA